MTPEHQYYKEVNSKDGAYYRRWAANIGPYMAKLIDTVLLAPQHEEQAYNSCNGILHMCKDFPKLTLEDIAKTCVESNACRYSYFKKLLKNKQNIFLKVLYISFRNTVTCAERRSINDR